MSNITLAQFLEMEARVAGNIAPVKAVMGLPDAVEQESDLHAEIAAELVRRRWFFVRSRMDKKTTCQKGVPDFICAAPDGRTYWIECKRKNAKLSKDQNITRHVLLALGHKHATVYSFEEFVEATKT